MNGEGSGSALGEWVWIALSFLLLFGLWEIAGSIPINLAFPRFSSVVAALWEMTVSGELARAMGSSINQFKKGLREEKDLLDSKKPEDPKDDA